ncbi:MAG: polysaccharide biosynthesis tyrosine autokinase [Verrucomicrobiota bacterium]
MNHHLMPMQISGPVPSSGKGFQDYLSLFVRRIWIFLILTTGGYMLGSFIHSRTPEMYQSFATIEILRMSQEAADVDEEEKIKMNGAAEMLSASEKLQMYSLFEEVAGGHLFANRENVVPRSFSMPWSEPWQPGRDELSDEALGGMMKNWVSVHWREDTNLLDLKATHSDPAIAQDTLIALLDEYERTTESRLSGSSEHALDYILENSNRLRDRMLLTDRAIQLYSDCLELSEEIRGLDSSISEMQRRYLDKWPALMEAKKHKDILEQRFEEEFRQVTQLSEEEKDFWNSSQAAIDESTETAEIDTLIQMVASRAGTLRRQLDSEQQVYDNLVTKLEEGNVSQGFERKRFQIVQPPKLPGGPINSNRQSIVLKYTFVGAAIAFGIILLTGYFDQSVKTVLELETFTESNVIGAFSSPTPRQTDNRIVFDTKENGKQSEAFRSLRSSMSLLSEEGEPVFLITSAESGEGKSWVASNLALAYAKQGKRVLLIDADLRQPTQDIIFGYDRNSVGLSDFLAKKAPLRDAIIRSDRSKNLFLLPAGQGVQNPAELLATERLGALLERMKDYFDCIVIDSAPLVPVSDSVPIAREVNTVVLVARMGSTPKGSIHRAIRILEENKTPIAGIIANGLPRTRTRFGHQYYYSFTGTSYYSYDNNRGEESSQPARSQETIDRSIQW